METVNVFVILQSSTGLYWTRNKEFTDDMKNVVMFRTKEQAQDCIVRNNLSEASITSAVCEMAGKKANLIVA